MNIGQLIKERRKSLGMTQTDLAKKIGVSTAAICKYEKNIISNIQRKKIIMLSKILNIPTRYFIEAYEYEEKTKLIFAEKKNNVNDNNITYNEAIKKIKQIIDVVDDLEEIQKQQIIAYLSLYIKNKN